MTLLTNCHGCLLIEKPDCYIPLSVMTQVATDTSGCVFVNRLPFGKEDMEVIIEILFLGEAGMTLQTISVGIRLLQRGRLGIMSAEE